VVSSVKSNSAQEAALEAPEYLDIGELAEKFDISPRTLRFYEEKGLITPLRNGKFRVYGATQEARLRLIIKGKMLGFTLTEISELLSDHEGIKLPLKNEKIKMQLIYLEKRRAEIDQAIAELKAFSYEGKLDGFQFC
jgi:DNA-binding transcriptional MerR regulator